MIETIEPPRLPDAPKQVALKIAALMSVPLCGYNPHYGCHSAALRPFGIGVMLAYGAYWHHGISNMFEDALANGTEWILTLDYDSMFTYKHIHRMITKILLHPEIDALAALQPRRGPDGAMLATVPNQKNLDTDSAGRIPVDVGDDPVAVDSAHFGLTFIRVEALKRMPLPWFLDLPNDSGSYKTLGRTDADMYFWRHFRECGNKAFVDMHSRIGHLDAYVSEFDDSFKLNLVHCQDWRAREFGAKTVVHSHLNGSAA